MRTLIQDFVLDAIADDYESLDVIVGDVSKWAEESGTSITRQGIIRALEQLIQEGSAQAYVLSSQPPYAQPVEFSSEDVDRLWFYLTPQGKRLVENLGRNANDEGTPTSG